MHYRNGRQAMESDPVIFETYKDSGIILAGKIHSLVPSTTTCNAQVAVAVPGGVAQHCVTVGDCLHAQDAWTHYMDVMKAEGMSQEALKAMGAKRTTCAAD